VGQHDHLFHMSVPCIRHWPSCVGLVYYFYSFIYLLIFFWGGGGLYQNRILYVVRREGSIRSGSIGKDFIHVGSGALTLFFCIIFCLFFIMHILFSVMLNFVIRGREGLHFWYIEGAFFPPVLQAHLQLLYISNRDHSENNTGTISNNGQTSNSVGWKKQTQFIK